MTETSTHDSVGPVLDATPLGALVADVIRARNPGTEIIDRGSYLRVCCPPPCTLESASVEALTGAPFRLPSDLERIMPSFQGTLELSEERAVWTRTRRKDGP